MDTDLCVLLWLSALRTESDCVSQMPYHTHMIMPYIFVWISSSSWPAAPRSVWMRWRRRLLCFWCSAALLMFVFVRWVWRFASRRVNVGKSMHRLFAGLVCLFNLVKLSNEHRQTLLISFDHKTYRNQLNIEHVFYVVVHYMTSFAAAKYPTKNIFL